VLPKDFALSYLFWNNLKSDPSFANRLFTEPQVVFDSTKVCFWKQFNMVYIYEGKMMENKNGSMIGIQASQ